MTLHAVCPYYACNEDCCDVGCGYITSHDASMISRYCSADYRSCGKFQELLVRLGTDADKIGEVRIPVILPEQPAPLFDKRNIAIGLTGGGLATLLYLAHKTGIIGHGVRLPAFLLLAAALLQLAAGLSALKKKSVRGIMFIGGGLFWTSLLALEVLPASGFGTATAPVPLSGYLVLWGFFGLIPLQAGLQVSKACRNYYGLGALFLFLLAAVPFTSSLVLYLACTVGLLTGLSGIWAGIRYLASNAPASSLGLDRKRAKT